MARLGNTPETDFARIAFITGDGRSIDPGIPDILG
jgi:hypothetical protein